MSASDYENGAEMDVQPKNSHVIPLRSVLYFLAASVATAIIVELLPSGQFWSTINHQQSACDGSLQSEAVNATPTYAVFLNGKTEGHLRHVFKVLDRMDFRRVSLSENWDLLWAHDYPFLKILQRLNNLKDHQMVNHFPGIGYLTNKVTLCTTALSFLPAAFRLPEQREKFLEYIKEHPSALFVEKHNEHRHIFIRAPADINLSGNNTFVQEFIENPLLVDGYKFDIGVYVVITSIDPLRVYIYTGDVLFRYCPVKYYPFDANNVDKYVVGDDYLPTWQVPSLVKFYQRFGGSMRASFDAYMRDQSRDPSGIWPQVEKIVRETILAKEQQLVASLKGFRSRNFFELIRFDLIIDDKLRVHLMEANMSPNLSSAHYKPNSLLYEQVLYSIFNLLGIGAPTKRTSLEPRSDEDEDMITADKSLAVHLNECVESYCDKSCNLEECELCLPCLSGSEYEILEKTHREHLHRIDMKRIFPKPIFNLEKYDIVHEVRNLSKRNEWITRWFYGKCLYDYTWCQ